MPGGDVDEEVLFGGGGDDALSGGDGDEGFMIEDEGDVGFGVEDARDTERDVIDDPISAAVEESMVAARQLCLICGMHPRKLHHLFCALGCEALIRAASRDAKAQGQAQFKAFRR